MAVKEQTIENLFSEMQMYSKVWIYQSNRIFTEEDKLVINKKVPDFIKSWESHGSKLSADFALVYDLFLIISVDENQHEASGCSIDKSVHFIKNIQKLTGISFFERTITAYFKQDKTIALAPLSTIQELVASGEITKDTLVFSNLAESVNELRTNWVIPAEKTWIARLL